MTQEMLTISCDRIVMAYYLHLRGGYVPAAMICDKGWKLGSGDYLKEGQMAKCVWEYLPCDASDPNALIFDIQSRMVRFWFGTDSGLWSSMMTRRFLQILSGNPCPVGKQLIGILKFSSIELIQHCATDIPIFWNHGISPPH